MTHPSIGPDRLPPLADAAMTAEQHAAVSALLQGPRGVLQGPFIPMMRSPGFMNRAQEVGAYIRYGSVLPGDLRELAIMVTARHWRQGIEWHLHLPIALAAGVPREVLVALAKDERPPIEGDLALVFDYCQELHRSQGVGDETYARAVAALGEAGVIDLTGLCGYYALLAMIMNVARTPIPDNGQPFAVPG